MLKCLSSKQWTNIIICHLYLLFGAVKEFKIFVYNVFLTTFPSDCFDGVFRPHRTESPPHETFKVKDSLPEQPLSPSPDHEPGIVYCLNNHLEALEFQIQKIDSSNTKIDKFSFMK